MTHLPLSSALYPTMSVSSLFKSQNNLTAIMKVFLLCLSLPFGSNPITSLSNDSTNLSFWHLILPFLSPVCSNPKAVSYFISTFLFQFHYQPEQ